MITLIYATCNTPIELLKYHTDVWQSMPKELAKNFKILIIDDGSNPPTPTDLDTGYIPVKIARVHEDIPWNTYFAFNLGFHLAENDWCALIQIDHVFRLEAMQQLVELKKERKNVYLFPRWICEEETGGEAKPRNKTVGALPLIHKEDFWATGGFDEEFTGCYGTGDWILFGRTYRKDWRHSSAMELNGMKFVHTNIKLHSHGMFSLSKSRYPVLNSDKAQALYNKKLKELISGTYKNNHKLLNKNWSIVRDEW